MLGYRFLAAYMIGSLIAFAGLFWYVSHHV